VQLTENNVSRNKPGILCHEKGFRVLGLEILDDLIAVVHLVLILLPLRLQPRLAIKNPPKKTQKHPKNPPKKTTKNVFSFCFLGFFKFLIFYENNIRTFLFETDFL
jgi:hypothetical protein